MHVLLLPPPTVCAGAIVRALLIHGVQAGDQHIRGGEYPQHTGL